MKNTFEEAKAKFIDYLTRHNLRKTQGRYDILYEIYEIDKHFEVENLYITLRNKNYHISRATIYNTIDLLLDCALIVRHSFGTKAGSYEKAFGINKHDHLINTDTKDVIEFENLEINEIAKKIAKQNNLDFSHYSFTVYGKPITNFE